MTDQPQRDGGTGSAPIPAAVEPASTHGAWGGPPAPPAAPRDARGPAGRPRCRRRGRGVGRRARSPPAGPEGNQLAGDPRRPRDHPRRRLRRQHRQRRPADAGGSRAWTRAPRSRRTPASPRSRRSPSPPRTPCQTPGRVANGPDPDPAAARDAGTVETAAPVDPGPVTPGAGVDVGAGLHDLPARRLDGRRRRRGLDGPPEERRPAVVGACPWTEHADRPRHGVPRRLVRRRPAHRRRPPGGLRSATASPPPASTTRASSTATQVDGAIVAGAVDGSGIIVNFFGASGSLSGVSADVDTILTTVQHTGG